MPQVLKNGKLASEFPGPPAFHEVVVDFFCYMIYFGFGGFLKPCLYKEFGKPCAFGRTLYDLDILFCVRTASTLRRPRHPKPDSSKGEHEFRNVFVCRGQQHVVPKKLIDPVQIHSASPSCNLLADRPENPRSQISNF